MSNHKGDEPVTDRNRFSKMSEKSLYSMSKLVTGMVTFPDTMASVATKPESTKTESRECRDLARIGVVGKVMERLHQFTIGFWGVAMR